MVSLNIVQSLLLAQDLCLQVRSKPTEGVTWGQGLASFLPGIVQLQLSFKNTFLQYPEKPQLLYESLFLLVSLPLCAFCFLTCSVPLFCEVLGFVYLESVCLALGPTPLCLLEVCFSQVYDSSSDLISELQTCLCSCLLDISTCGDTNTPCQSSLVTATSLSAYMVHS
jgi:hypothetical protein